MPLFYCIFKLVLSNRDKNKAKIFDLSEFLSNTRCCVNHCKKIAYMVKYG